MKIKIVPIQLFIISELLMEDIQKLQ